MATDLNDRDIQLDKTRQELKEAHEELQEVESKAPHDQALGMAPLVARQSNAVSRGDRHPRRHSETKKADALITAAVAAGVDVADSDAFDALTKQFVVPFGCTDYQWDGGKMQPFDKQEMWRGFGR